VCGMMRLELKPSAEPERSLFGFARYPLTAQRMAGSEKMRLSLEMPAQASYFGTPYIRTHSCVHAKAASISDASLRFLPLAEV